MVQLLRIYTPIENRPFLKEIAPFASTAFFVVYACLLITDGYYFLVFIVLGFSAGLFYTSHQTANVDYSHFERHLSYKEQALEQVSGGKKEGSFAMQHKNNLLISLVKASSLQRRSSSTTRR